MNTPSARRPNVWVWLVLATGASALLLLAGIAGCSAGSPVAQKSIVTPSPLIAQNTPTAQPPASPPPDSPALAAFHKDIQPILENNCYDCHADGKDKGGVAFDKIKTDDQLLKNPDLWLKVLKYTRTGIMPAEGPRVSAKDQAVLDNWIKFTAFGADPQNLDPGRVTIHRLNRTEYRNTIHDLLGVDFDTDLEFPSDDIGYGFDNIADVLNVSPMLMEKYLSAAQTVVDQAVPVTSRVPATQVASGKDFLDAETGKNGIGDVGPGRNLVGMSFFSPAKVSHTFSITQEGDYNIKMEKGLVSDVTFTTATCTVTIFIDGKQVSQKVQPWHGTNSNAEIFPSFYETFQVHWLPGDHQVTVTVEPLAGGAKSIIAFQVRKVTVEGPIDPAKWVHPANYERFFTRDQAPDDPAARRAYARELLGAFATKAFRRPVPAESLDKLVSLAEKVYTAPGKTFEQGVAQAMVAVLASPRFLFRIDQPLASSDPAKPYALVDEYSLASRLSYFLWSTMPDDELIKLAAAGQLRNHLAEQVQRMIADPRANAFIRNFSSQWLQSRAVLNIPLSAKDILAREGITAGPADEVTMAQRIALNEEAAAYFGYVLRNDRSIDEFLDSNYIFLNSTLASYYYDATYARNFTSEMRKVELSPGDWRGGVLTMGSVMMVTSNPTRTSPVKRGKWVLENILGTPVPPPPPNIPALEESGKKTGDHTPTMRETLAAHRADPLCASCHDRMDPIGLAMENFDAFGSVRTVDLGQPIDASGQLSTGEKFKDVRDLKHILITDHREEFYQCLTDKLMTYAVGRGMEYYDVPAIDKIVDSLDTHGGHFSSLLNGVINSAAFQEERTMTSEPATQATPAPILSLNNPRP